MDSLSSHLYFKDSPEKDMDQEYSLEMCQIILYALEGHPQVNSQRERPNRKDLVQNNTLSSKSYY